MFKHRKQCEVWKSSQAEGSFVDCKCGKTVAKSHLEIHNNSCPAGGVELDEWTNDRLCVCGREYNPSYLFKHRKRCEVWKSLHAEGRFVECKCGKTVAKSHLESHNNFCPTGGVQLDESTTDVSLTSGADDNAKKSYKPRPQGLPEPPESSSEEKSPKDKKKKKKKKKEYDGLAPPAILLSGNDDLPPASTDATEALSSKPSNEDIFLNRLLSCPVCHKRFGRERDYR